MENIFDILVQPDLLNKFLKDAGRWEDCFKKKDYPYNVIETNTAMILEFALAGWAKEELEIKMENNLLSIIGKHHQDKQANINFLHKDIAKRNFTTSFTLGNRADKAKIKSEFINGLLTITIPFIEKEVKSVEIVSIG